MNATILLISISAIIFVFYVGKTIIVETNLIYKNTNDHNQTVVDQYSELSRYEHENNLKLTPPPNIGRRKGGYIYLIPHPNQVKYFNEKKP